MLTERATRTGLRPLMILCAILALFSAAAAQDARQIEAEIRQKADAFNLGAPQKETAAPRQLPAPRSDVWMQSFERGRVYWKQGVGAHALFGDIGRRWDFMGGERGSVGFPLTDEFAPCTDAAGRDRVQLFENAAIYWTPGVTRQPAVIFNRISTGDWTVCLSGDPKDSAGLFRVTITGFTVNQQTSDNILETDGKGDEVYLTTDIAQYDSYLRIIRDPETFPRYYGPLGGADTFHGKGNLTNRRSLTGLVMGDIDNQENPPRTMAGDAGDYGGLRTGNNFPRAEPWNLRGRVYPDRIPMVLWEGELRRNLDLVMIVPTLWEWDGGNPQLRSRYAQDVNDFFSRRTLINQGFEERGFIGGDIAGAGDRPIGMAGNVQWMPPGIILNFDMAKIAAGSSPSQIGTGIIELRYEGVPASTESYSLYFKVERLK